MVRLNDVNDWASSFVGGIHVTAIGVGGDSTLTFTWSTLRQRITSGWNGTWVREGSTVTVTSSASLASRTDVGFVADYGGPNILPAAFSLNGVLCSAG